ncbi:MAG: S9 family peptidase [Pseudomonadota bacterium]
MQHFISPLLALLALTVAWLSPATAQTFTLADLAKITDVRTPRITPDGQSVAVIVSQPDYEANRFHARLVLVDVETGEKRDLTFDRPSVSRPRWSPDGQSIAFVASDKDGVRQVFHLPIAGGEARAITAHSKSVAAFEWSADGSEVFFIAADPNPEPVEGPERHNKSFRAGHNDFLATEQPTPLRIWRAPSSGGKAVRLGGDELHVQASQLSWFGRAPNGSTLVVTGFVAGRANDFREARVFLVDTQTGQHRVAPATPKKTFWAAVSPDGQSLAFTRSSVAGNSSFKTRHVAISAMQNDSAAKNITPDIDRSFWGGWWMPNSKGLLIGARDAARNSIWYQPLEGMPQRLELGDLEPVTTYGPVDLDVGRKGQIAFTATTSQRPKDLYWLDSLTGKPRRLTDFASDIAALDLGVSEEITWATDGGFEANGILTYPPGFSADTKYPLVLAIHGGPPSASTLRFDRLHQLMAARGFVVFAPNYRGSDNLGARYQAAIVDNAGTGPGRDVMAGIEAIKQRGIVDESRIAVTGWSYGGYMTSWLIGNYPDVWRAAMAGAAVTDYVDSYAFSDVNSFFGDAFSAPPWKPEMFKIWRQESPISYAYKTTTPTLIMSMTGDLRVPITESYKLYSVLHDQNTPVEFIGYPIPGHFPGDPVHQRDVYRRWVDWVATRFEMPRDAPVSE